MHGADARREEARAHADRRGLPTSAGHRFAHAQEVEAILKARLEMVPVEDERQQELPVVVHENVRGGDYYDTDQQQPKEKANP